MAAAAAEGLVMAARYMVVRCGPDVPANLIPREHDGRWFELRDPAPGHHQYLGRKLWPTGDYEIREDGVAAEVHEIRSLEAERSVEYVHRVMLVTRSRDDYDGTPVYEQVHVTRRYMRVGHLLELAILNGNTALAVGWLPCPKQPVDYLADDGVDAAFRMVEERAAHILARRTP